MKPGSFDFDTSREAIGDSRARTIEAKARADAETGTRMPPERGSAATYWGQVMQEFEAVVYSVTFERRTARIARKGAPCTSLR